MATSRFRLHPTLPRTPIQPSRFYALFRRPTRKIDYRGVDDGFERCVRRETRVKFSER